MTDTTPAAGIDDPPLSDWEVTITMTRRPEGPDGPRELRDFTAIVQARTEDAATDGAWQIGHGINEASGYAWKFASLEDRPNVTARRLDDDPEPVHGYFGLTYANYAVLHRTLMQSMPVDWQRRMVACLHELDEAYRHIDRAEVYTVEAAREVEYHDLTEEQMTALGVTREERSEGFIYYNRHGEEYEGWQRAAVPLPGGDPLPHYNRGRTHVEPATKEA